MNDLQFMPHQEEVLNLTDDKNRCAYYLDMGLGKTFVGAEKMYLLNNTVNLIVCQKSKVDDWVDHMKTYYPEYRVMDLTKKSEGVNFRTLVETKDLYDQNIQIVGVINYDLVFRRKYIAHITDFTLLLDESSLICNENAKRSKFILKLQPESVILLSGTPTAGKYERLWSQLKLLGWDINKKAFYASYVQTEWIENGDGYKKEVITGYKHVEHLKKRLTQFGAVFMKTEEVIELPEQTEQKIFLKITNEYKFFIKHNYLELDTRNLVRFKDDSDFEGEDVTPRVALRNMGIPVKAIDYVEIDEKAVRSYNAMFADELSYETQSVVNWNLKPDILIHGSPCQDFSIAGHQGKATAADGRINKGKGADEGSGTRSSLMWETVHIIEQMGEWKPTVVVWENVKNVLSKHMIHNFNRYLSYMEKLGYSNNYKVLDARDYGIPQARQRCFTVSVLGDHPFDFELMQKRPMRDISNFLESGNISDCYMVTQPSVYNSIGKKGIRRAKVIEDYANTITTRQDRTPAQVIDLGDGKYRYLTELECWRLMGYSDEDYYAAESTCKVEPGKMNRTLYHQSGNSIVVPIFEEMFRVIISDILERKDVNVQK